MLISTYMKMQYNDPYETKHDGWFSFYDISNMDVYKFELEKRRIYCFDELGASRCAEIISQSSQSTERGKILGVTIPGHLEDTHRKYWLVLQICNV